jgi:hypothetical protein
MRQIEYAVCLSVEERAHLRPLMIGRPMLYPLMRRVHDRNTGLKPPLTSA